MLRTCLAFALLAVAACNKDESTPKKDLGECDAEGPEQILVAREILLARNVDGVSQGFDLDGLDGSAGCGVEDLVDPEGATGIDNSLAALLPVLEQTEAAALEPIIQDSVNGGALLLMFGLTDLDSVADDECVDVDVFKGLGIPMIGNDGYILANQTLDVNPDTPVTPAPTGSMVDGRLEVGPIEEVLLTLVVLDLNETFALTNVRVRLEPQDDGTWKGIIAGGVAIQDIIDVITLQNVSDEVFELVAPVLALVADLAPDANGDCQEISITLTFDAVPAFLYEE